MTSPYPSLAQKTAELKKLAEAGQWEDASRLMASITAKVPSFPAPQPADRAALESALADFKEVGERAVPLHADIAKLLAAFGPARPAA
ncbi:hypothetical protein AGMMS49960_00660 [Betaproteobacteria bacterium]|nr:hypothetical protein AGMMS49543_07000 [Betaproteobacteria bacterium]GHT98150.1 hypothetical protein AGMMS49960_00660 [Betaproteobacteria bacterium]GHU08703.1 hypothetical protein AGMMS50225_07840 [Betaproteobacteria bacterium]